ncbi:MAG: DUF4293 domain-containing protein [Bacteroidales bacterium]|nr:DUF4293 domain-containing protein [Bacteroidales bacterium]
MIQRIQTLWLSLAVLLCVAAFFFPLAMFGFSYRDISISAIYKLLPVNTAPYQNSPALFALIANCLSGILALVTIFLYKNRRLQMRVLAFAFLFAVMELAVIYFYQLDAGLEEAVTSLYKSTPQAIASAVENARTTWGLASYFPIAQIIFFIFALNGIKKDEALVRSADRLR